MNLWSTNDPECKLRGIGSHPSRKNKGAARVGHPEFNAGAITMRRIVFALLLLFAFAIPWEYSLDLGEPLGNVARIAGLLLLLVAIPAVLQAKQMRAPGAMQWAVLAFYLYFCCSYFWTIDQHATLDKIRSLFQELMTVWLVGEFCESPRDFRNLLRATVAGSWVLALLTLASFASAEAIANQIRFVAEGQDPNDVARFLNLGFPMAALLFGSETRWPGRLLALGYLPLGLFAVLLTASRGGALAAGVALAGCGILLARRHAGVLLAAVVALPALAAGVWLAVPQGTFERLGTITEQLQGGDLNDRVNIWMLGWHAFTRAPWFGTGAGTFVSAAGLAPVDTAHNTALSILVNGGLCGLFLAFAILALAVGAIVQTKGPIRLAMGIALSVWALTSLVATVEENRTTWLLFALIAAAARLAVEQPEALDACFPSTLRPVAERELAVSQ
jgi:O-antigen ligase